MTCTAAATCDETVFDLGERNEHLLAVELPTLAAPLRTFEVRAVAAAVDDGCREHWIISLASRMRLNPDAHADRIVGIVPLDPPFLRRRRGPPDLVARP